MGRISLLVVAIVIIVSACVLAAAIMHVPPVAPNEPPTPASFDAGLRARGARVVALGDCASAIPQEEGGPFTHMEPNFKAVHDQLKTIATQHIGIANKSSPAEPTVNKLSARYIKRYLLHGSIGPSCSVGLMAADNLTVWTHSQGVYPLRDALAEMLSMSKEKVRCIHVEGSGCYGHNGADDVAAHAALVDRPGTPFLGTAEAAMGPTVGALADALYDAIGKRQRSLPIGGAGLPAQINV